MPSVVRIASRQNTEPPFEKSYGTTLT